MKDVNPDEVSHEELKSAYRNLLNSRNSLRENNRSLSKMQNRLVSIVNTHIPHVILVVQALAEKANCRRDPAIVEVLEYLDGLSHPQWNNLPKRPNIPVLTAMASDGDEGDAEMLLNADVAKAMLPIDDFFLSSLPREKAEVIRGLVGAIQEATVSAINHAKLSAGFKPRKVSWSSDKHPSEMTKEELREMLDALSWGVLDLAQDMDFSRSMLRLDLRDGAYRRIASDLYHLCHISHAEQPGSIDVKVFGDEPVPF